MKTPSWAIIIGILLMLFGGCGLMKNSQAVMMPDVMEMQQKMLDGTFEALEEQELEDQKAENENLEENVEEYFAHKDSLLTEENEEDVETVLNPNGRNRKVVKVMRENMKEMFTISEFNRKWTIRFGYIGLFVCAVYLISGALLANRKVYAINFVYGALALSIVFALAQMLTLSFDTGSGFLGKLGAYGSMFGLVLDIVLLIVFIAIDKKDYFKSNQPPAPLKEDWENF